MKFSWYYTTDTWVLCVGQFIVMMVAIEIGRRISMRRGKLSEDNPAHAAIIAALYGLMGLLLAFTFGMSGERFKTRKEVIVNEANAISTAIGRIDLYADTVQPYFRKNFREYLEARIRYSEARDTTKARAALIDAERHAKAIWKVATANSRIPSNLVASNQMVPALNQMFDIANTRLWGEYERTPGSILTMLFLLSVTTAFMSGYTSQGKGKLDWLMAACFCLLTSLVIFFIIDLDKPRRGLITLDAHQKAIIELRKMLKDE